MSTDADAVAAAVLRNVPAVTSAARLIAAGERTNDASLRARHALERELGIQGTDIAGYLRAAEEMDRRDMRVHAEALRAIATTEHELAAARTAWDQRHNARPPSLAEQVVGRWIEQQHVLLAEPYRQGIDGCFYALSRLCGEAQSAGEYAVTVMTSARRPLLVTGFGDQQAAQSWLRDRAPRPGGPLAACHVGPDCRTAREEQLLAGLLHAPTAILDNLPVTATTWTADLRAEIFLAWRTAAPSAGSGPSPAAVARELDRRMLRAPDGSQTLASGYLARLAATAVTPDRALDAGRMVCAEDIRAAAHRSDAVLAEMAERWPPRPAARPDLQPPPPGLMPGAPGPVPHR